MQETETKPLRVVSLDKARAARSVTKHALGSLAEAWAVYQTLAVWRDADRLADSTRTQYRRAVELALDPANGLAASGWDEEDVTQWMTSTRARYQLSARTMNGYRRGLLAVLTAAKLRTHDHRLADAVQAARPITETEVTRKAPPLDVLARVTAMCRDRGEVAFVRLMAVTALRVGEVLALTPDDYDPVTRVLTVTRSRNKKRAGKRKNRKRHLPRLDSATAADLAWCIAHSHELRSKTGRFKGYTNGHIFPWGLTRVGNMMERFREQLGAEADAYFPPGDAWHVLRHLSATVTARETGDMVRVKNKLGDASMSAAMGYIESARGVTVDDGELVAGILEKARQLGMFAEVARLIEAKGAGTVATEKPSRNAVESTVPAVTAALSHAAVTSSSPAAADDRADRIEPITTTTASTSTQENDYGNR